MASIEGNAAASAGRAGTVPMPRARTGRAFALLRRVPYALDGGLALISFGATVAVFGSGSGRLGFYSDDSGFLTALPHDGFAATLRAARDYVPGRNLHIIWQQLLFLVGGDRPSDLGNLHLLQSVMDGITVVLFFVLLRTLLLPRVWAVLGTALFAFYPNHGETHFWLSSGPMNVISTMFLLAYAIVAVQAMRLTRRTRAAPPRRLLAAELLFFGLALFTYDQTFFCLLLVLALQVLQTVKERVRPTPTALATYVGSVAIALLDVHLKQDPASGPTLAHAGLGHVLKNVTLSFSMTWGGVLQSQLQFLLKTASRPQELAAIACAVGVFAIAILLITRSHVRRRPTAAEPAEAGAAARRVALRHAACCAAGVLVFFLAYLPADAWFISPRHNFLPTAGVALAVASAAAALWTLARGYVHRYAADGFALVCAAGAAYAVFFFVEAGLSEKSYWASAYQLRLSLYRQLIDRHLLDGKSAIVFQNFPASLGPAPFFGQENQNALLYLYDDRVSLTESSVSALEAPSGYYLYNEIDRYGIADRYLPTRKVADVVYRSQSGDRIDFTIGDERYLTSRFYDVRRSPVAGTDGSSAAGPIRAASIRVRGRDLILTLDLDLGQVELAPEEELGLLLSHRDAGTEVPLVGQTPYGERMLIPIGLVRGPLHGRGRASLSVLLKDPAFTSANSLSLYVFNSEVPHLLQEAPIAR